MNPYENLYQALEKQALSTKFLNHAADVAGTKTIKRMEIDERLKDYSPPVEHWDGTLEGGKSNKLTSKQQDIVKAVRERNQAKFRKTYNQEAIFRDAAHKQRLKTIKNMR